MANLQKRCFEHYDFLQNPENNIKECSFKRIASGKELEERIDFFARQLNRDDNLQGLEGCYDSASMDEGRQIDSSKTDYTQDFNELYNKDYYRSILSVSWLPSNSSGQHSPAFSRQACPQCQAGSPGHFLHNC